MSTLPVPLEAVSRRRRLRGGLRSLPVSVRIGSGIVVVLALAAVLGPLLSPYGQDQLDYANLSAAPSPSHPFGTDDSGRDVFTRALAGLRTDLGVALLITYIAVPIGILAGAAAGFFGGWVDAVISRVIDVVVAIPFVVLVIAIVAIVGPGLKGVMIGVPLAGWALYARLARAEMLVLREQPFMLATTALGYTRKRAMFRHAIPNLVRSSLIYSTVDLVVNLLLLASLSYLGLGAQPGTPSLGMVIADGQSTLLDAWWVATLPGLMLVFFGVGVGLIGDGLSDGNLRGGRT